MDKMIFSTAKWIETKFPASNIINITDNKKSKMLESNIEGWNFSIALKNREVVIDVRAKDSKTSSMKTQIRGDLTFDRVRDALKAIFQFLKLEYKKKVSTNN